MSLEDELVQKASAFVSKLGLQPIAAYRGGHDSATRPEITVKVHDGFEFVRTALREYATSVGGVLVDEQPQENVREFTFTHLNLPWGHSILAFPMQFPQENACAIVHRAYQKEF